MFLPVGRTSGLRIGSPPGPGTMYLPSRADTRAPSSLSATICLRQNSRYSKSGESESSATSKPSAESDFFQDDPPLRPANAFSRPLKIGATSSIRPSALVDESTSERTAARQALVIFTLSSTSSRTPLLLLR